MGKLTDTPEMIRQRAYRKRRTARQARYQAALERIASNPAKSGVWAADVAYRGLHGDLREQLEASLVEETKP